MSARGYDTDPNIYFGLPGNLITLPWPQGGVVAPVDRSVFLFETGNGGYQSSTLLGTSRSYTLSWEALHQKTFDPLNAYWLGHRGAGPFCIIDPSRPNLLTPAQSSATGFSNSNLDWVLGPLTTGKFQGALSQNLVAANIHGTHSVASMVWTTFTAVTLDTPYCILSPSVPYHTWYGTPVVVGLPYTFALWAKAAVVNPLVDVQLVWLDITGAQISISHTGDTAFTAGTWYQPFITDVAPAGAVFVQPRVLMKSSSLTSPTAALYIDEPQLEQTDTVYYWAPGTGAYAVSIVGLSEAIPFDANMRLQPTLSLREIVP